MDISKEGLENEFNGIGKNPEILKSETAEQPKNSEIITENLTQPSQLPEESSIKLKVERDLLMQSFERAKEFMRTQKSRYRCWKKRNRQSYPTGRDCEKKFGNQP